MAVVDKPRNYVKIFIIFFALFLLLSVSIALLIKAQPKKPDLLPEGSFSSSVERRTALRADGTPYEYYVINTRNNTSQNYYSCKQTIDSKGNRLVYYGLLKSYTEKNCRPIPTGRTQYDCLLANWWHRYQLLESVQNYRELVPGSSYEIPVGSYYETLTPPQKAFTSANQLNDIFSVTTACKSASGTPVAHTQTF